MAQSDTTFDLKIYDNPPGMSASDFFRNHFKILASGFILPFFILSAPHVSVAVKISTTILFWGGVIWYFVRHALHGTRKPVLEANHRGFRIKGGRLRPWGTFLGARIDRHYVDHEEVSSFCVQLLGQSFHGAARVGTYLDYSGADRAVQQILSFKRGIDAQREAEADNFAAGPAPVVAARAKRFEMAVKPVSVLERIGFMIGRY